MKAFRRIAGRRVPAALLALAGLFHVQWLAACEFMPAAGVGMACCAEEASGETAHCDDQAQGHDCVTPFVKGGSGVKLPERIPAADTDAPDSLFTVSAFQWADASHETDPPPWSGARPGPDGRSLYLSSGRLRL